MVKDIYLIEKIELDWMENNIHLALKYSHCGYIEGLEKAKKYCNNGICYTKKDCWAIFETSLPEFRFSKLENILGEK